MTINLAEKVPLNREGDGNEKKNDGPKKRLFLF